MAYFAGTQRVGQGNERLHCGEMRAGDRIIKLGVCKVQQIDSLGGKST